MKANRFLAAVLGTAIAAGGILPAAQVNAETVSSESSSQSSSQSSSKPYISLGADLSASQRKTVLELFGITEEDLKNDTVVTITNEEEHNAYDSYLSSSVIGTKALSCSMVTQKKDGSGISVKTKNITYCTEEMYENALVTAGMKNADVVVAGPVQLSGTAALLGVTKAYSSMTGKTLKAENIDAAAEEVVVTSDLGKTTGDKKKAAELIASVKEGVASGKIDSDDIDDAIEETAEKMNIELTDEQEEKIEHLMSKIDGLDLNVKTLSEQAGNIYNELKKSGLNIDKVTAKNWFTRIVNFLKGLFD